MASNSTRLCRLCLKASDDAVNIFAKFNDSTIASILSQHFWFQVDRLATVLLFTLRANDSTFLYSVQVHRNDGFPESLCKLCWTNTKTFHDFYKEVEELQKDYWNLHKLVENDSCGDHDETVETDSCSDLIKHEQSGSATDASLEPPDLIIVKCEDTEPPLEVIDVQISRDESFDCNDDNTCDQSNFFCLYCRGNLYKVHFFFR